MSYNEEEETELVAHGHRDADDARARTVQLPHRQHSIQLEENIACCARLKLLCCPVRSFANQQISRNDQQVELELVPEAFRMWFYVYFFFFVVVAMLVTRTWGTTDFEDNPILHRFGTNNACVYFDDPPFSIFASTLWFPATVLILSYQILDQIRVYDLYKDTDGHAISRCFYVYYTTSTILESFSFVLFSQVFATSPTEHFYMHTWPYFLLLYALWFLGLKRFIYLWKTGEFSKYQGYVYVLGCVYIVLYLVTIIIKVSTGIPNLYGARLWESYPWITPVVDVNGQFYNFVAIIAPVIIYTVMSTDIDTVTLVINSGLKSK